MNMRTATRTRSPDNRSQGRSSTIEPAVLQRDRDHLEVPRDARGHAFRP